MKVRFAVVLSTGLQLIGTSQASAAAGSAAGPGAPAASADQRASDQASPVMIQETVQREITRLAGAGDLALQREAIVRRVGARLAAERSRTGETRDARVVRDAIRRTVHEVLAEQARSSRLSAPARPVTSHAARQSLVLDGSAIPAGERTALIDLYDSTNGAGWTHRDNWRNAGDTDFNAPGTECAWFGVVCDGGQTTVLQLRLNGSNLVGTLPSTLGNLTNLEWIQLFDNQLTGSIPDAIGDLTHLQGLVLSDNQLTGSIPPRIGDLTNLQLLNLSYNQLTGSIPPGLGSLTNLTGLYLYVNQLTGSIPPELGNLTNLTMLFLRTNQLAGSIPTELGNLTSLSELYLNNNQLTGPIPTELGNLTNLSELYLSNNRLMGSIPAQLGNLTSLQRLGLDVDQLTGSIPPELGSLTSLTDLSLTGNQLTGSIPPELGNLTSLTELSLSANQLTGSIPPELGNLTNLTELFLDANQLTGSIPPQLGNLTSLEGLVLTGNQLTGPIPPQLGNLTNLLYLVLSDNQLTGSIPPELGNLAKLGKLYLANNRLTGTIPAQLGNLTSYLFWHLDLHSNQLTGAVPGSITRLTSLRSDAWNVTDFRWNGVYSSDPTVVAFLDGAQTGGDWQSTQTVPVTGLTAGVATSSSVALTWTPIAYTGDTGGYQVFVATASGGPYTLSGTTADKTAGSWWVTGLDPGASYYFIVKSVTNPHADNRNSVVSDSSAEVFRSCLAALAITTTSPLAAGFVGQGYVQTFAATGGGGPPYSWTVVSGTLPAGLLLSSGGALSGDPTTPGSFSFTVQVTDAAGNTGSAPFTLQVNGAAASIPALGEWGRLVLVLLMVLIGFDLLRRRRDLA